MGGGRAALAVAAPMRAAPVRSWLSGGRQMAPRQAEDGPAAEVLRPRSTTRKPSPAGSRDELVRTTTGVQAGGLPGPRSTPSPHADAPWRPLRPTIADLLARLLVEEPTSEPFDAVRRLLTEVCPPPDRARCVWWAQPPAIRLRPCRIWRS